MKLLITLVTFSAIGCASGSGSPAEVQNPAPVAASEDSLDQPIILADHGAVWDAEADSAADAAILEALAESSFDSTPVFDIYGVGGPGAMATPVTWNIQVQPFIGHDRVRYYIDFFQGKARDRFAIWLTRLPQYETMIRDSMIANDLPSDMVYLAMIESGYSNTAVSRSRAVGMWQFMRGTGKMYGLRIDYWVDERRDPYKATDAAARHLADLRDRFGSLFLAAAAYNAGAGRVSRGLRRLPADQRDPDEFTDETFFQLYQTRYLVRETKDYVPKLIAAALIAKQPEKYGFVVPEGILPLEYDSLTVPDATGLDVLARLADTSLRAIQRLNPQYIRLATPPGERSLVRVPLGAGALTQVRYAEVPATERVTYLVHVVKNEGHDGGDRSTVPGFPQILAAGQPECQCALPQDRIQADHSDGGSSIPRGAVGDEPDPNRPNVTYHKVRNGESIWSISQRYGISQSQLRSWNRLSGDVIRPGQSLRVAK